MEIIMIIQHHLPTIYIIQKPLSGVFMGSEQKGGASGRHCLTEKELSWKVQIWL